MIEEADAYGIFISKARHETEQSSGYYRPIALIGIGDTQIELPHLHWPDMPKRTSDGEFRGCNNRAWILSEAEKEHYIDLNAERQAAIDAEKAEEARIAAQKRADREVRKSTHTIKKVHDIVQPDGRETGRDGWWDVSVADAGGKVTRVIVRNVYDVGYYGYPQRVAGTNGAFVREAYTQEEAAALEWALEFSPLPHNVIM